MYIKNWNELQIGDRIAEDTYNEVYEVFEKDGEKWIRQVGWQIGDKPVPEYERPLDFDPDCPHDQPWFLVKRNSEVPSSCPFCGSTDLGVMSVGPHRGRSTCIDCEWVKEE